MRRGRILIFLVLIVVIGLALLYFAYTQLGNIAAQPTQAALTEVYFAAQNIPQGTTIKVEMLGTFSIPPENVAEVMFTKGEEGALVGQTARLTLDQGVVITSSMVGAGPVEIAGPSWAAKIPSVWSGNDSTDRCVGRLWCAWRSKRQRVCFLDVDPLKAYCPIMHPRWMYTSSERAHYFP
jgi:hypothetical protein